MLIHEGNTSTKLAQTNSWLVAAGPPVFGQVPRCARTSTRNVVPIAHTAHMATELQPLPGAQAKEQPAQQGGEEGLQEGELDCGVFHKLESFVASDEFRAALAAGAASSGGEVGLLLPALLVAAPRSQLTTLTPAHRHATQHRASTSGDQGARVAHCPPNPGSPGPGGEGASSSSSYVVVDSEDAVEAMAYYLAQCIAAHPEAQKLAPKQLQDALALTLQVWGEAGQQDLAPRAPCCARTSARGRGAPRTHARTRAHEHCTARTRAPHACRAASAGPEADAVQADLQLRPHGVPLVRAHVQRAANVPEPMVRGR